MRHLVLTSCLLCAVVLGCATPSAPTPSGPPPDWKLASASVAVGNNFQGTGGNGGGQISLTMSGHSINGPVASLYSSSTKVRGTGNSGRSVDVTIVGNKANGLVGSIPFSCIVEIQPDGSAHITGAMGVGNTDYVISPKAINGRVGVVTYNLAWNGEKYEGQMVPGGYGYLQLPVVMATWGDVEAATVLSLILMGA
jgi:hypothetical protein